MIGMSHRKWLYSIQEYKRDETGESRENGEMVWNGEKIIKYLNNCYVWS